MRRLVQPKVLSARPQATAASGETNGSTYLERVVNYIPAEVVSGYVALTGVVNGLSESDGVKLWLLISLFALGVVLTPVHLIRLGKPKKGQLSNVVIATIAFTLWGYATGGPFALLPHYHQAVGALAVGVFTWAIGLYLPTITEKDAVERAA